MSDGSQKQSSGNANNIDQNDTSSDARKVISKIKFVYIKFSLHYTCTNIKMTTFQCESETCANSDCDGNNCTYAEYGPEPNFHPVLDDDHYQLYVDYANGTLKPMSKYE